MVDDVRMLGRTEFCSSTTIELNESQEDNEDSVDGISEMLELVDSIELPI